MTAIHSEFPKKEPRTASPARLEKLALAAESLRLEFPPELPVSRAADEILAAWKHHQVIIVGGDTGSGKTTQLPKIALALGLGRKGRIGCTQPRRLAACAMARRVAEETGAVCGEGVGYQVRFDDHTTDSTVLKFMTDGILLAETRNDCDLHQYECLIIDEAHERSLNIDFLLGYLKRLLPRRPDLKVAISSATLDVEQFSTFFFHAPVIAVQGRTFPVEDMYMPPDPDEDLDDQVGRAVEFATDLDPRGDILIFLPGEREIRDCAGLLEGRNFPRTEVLTLFARLSAADQQKVFRPGNFRRIIVSTNVAETSVTIPRIRFVIDSGLARVKRYNPRSRIEELQIESISQASARQRRGRCGRIADGVCIHLYSEHDLANAAPYTDPEIRRSGLAGVILQMAALRLGRISLFPFLDPPPPAAIHEGVKTLEDIRALTQEGRVTPDGWLLASIPLDPHLGKMLLSARSLKVLPEVLVIAAFLSIQDPRERPREKQQAADDAHRKFRHAESDFFTVLQLWNALGEKNSGRLLRNFCRDHFLNFNRIREWRNLTADIAGLPDEKVPVKVPPSFDMERVSYDLVHQAILSGIPRNLGRYFKEGGYYIGCGGRNFQLFPGSGLFKRKPVPEWLMTFALVETTRVFARQNAVIRPELAERAAPHLCTKTFDRAEWDEASGFVYAREKLSIGGLEINPGRRVHYAKTHPAEAREIFIRQGLAKGLVSIPGNAHWVAENNRLLEDLRRLEIKVRRPDSIVNEEAVADHYLLLLPAEINSTVSLRDALKTDQQNYCISREDAMQEQFTELDPMDYPDELVFFGQKFPLRYIFEPGEDEDGVTLVAPTDKLPLVPDYALDYLVPGYLPDKIELMIRALPKDLRRNCGPALDCVRDFCSMLKNGEVFSEQPLTAALAEFLSEQSGQSIASADFGELRLPSYLRMKLLERGANGRETLHFEVPAMLRNGSKLSPLVARKTGLASVSGKWELFRDGPLPETVELPNGNGKIAYPALTVEKDTQSVQPSLFLKETEAHLHHRLALLKLFRDTNANQLKFLKRTLAFRNEMKLSWAMEYPEMADDFLDVAVTAAFGIDPWKIRSRSALDEAMEKARENAGSCGDELFAELGKIYLAYAKVKQLLPKARARSRGGAAEIERQLGVLFRPGFFRSGEAVFDNYSRYLRGAAIRAERMSCDPAKDTTKTEAIEWYLEHLSAALDATEDLSTAPDLEEFWLLTEEARLAVYAPEVPQAVRAPVKKLAEAWETLRF